MTLRIVRPLFAWLALGLLSACGGGSSSNGPSPPTDATRASAVAQTASAHPDCNPAQLGPYYWEIGDRDGPKAGASVGADAPGPQTVMSIASASKWVYAAYVVEKVGVRAADLPYLNFTSGYSLFRLPLCRVFDTVGSCLTGNDALNPDTVGRYFYDSGHMQQHAGTVMGLGPLGNAALTEEIGGVLRGPGETFGLAYTQPQLAGGLAGSASSYAQFLRRILRGELAIGAALGTNKVCTNPTTCDTAVAAPVPRTESWNYSLGHWVEDDPAVGDHAFSSAGALGFYPWIDRTKTLYGILARRTDDLGVGGFPSARCGRLLRQAWVTARPVPSGPPTPAS